MNICRACRVRQLVGNFRSDTSTRTTRQEDGDDEETIRGEMQSFTTSEGNTKRGRRTIHSKAVSRNSREWVANVLSCRWCCGLRWQEESQSVSEFDTKFQWYCSTTTIDSQILEFPRHFFNCSKFSYLLLIDYLKFAVGVHHNSCGSESVICCNYCYDDVVDGATLRNGTNERTHRVLRYISIRPPVEVFLL